MPNIDKALEEILRVSSLDSEVIFSIPNLHAYDSLEDKFGVVSRIVKTLDKVLPKKSRKKLNEFHRSHEIGHIHKHTPTEWKSMISESGFEIKDTHACFISPYIPNFLDFLKKLELKYYKHFLKIHYRIEKKISAKPIIKYLGQHIIFKCKIKTR